MNTYQVEIYDGIESNTKDMIHAKSDTHAKRIVSIDNPGGRWSTPKYQQHLSVSSKVYQKYCDGRCQVILYQIFPYTINR